MSKSVLYIKGMHGLGDNVHQRAIIKQLLPKYDIWLESSWVSMYHDYVAQGLKVIWKSMPLRAQTKNAERERDLFCKEKPPDPRAVDCRQVWWRAQEVRTLGSVLASMFAQVEKPGSGELNYNEADFRLPIPPSWYPPVERLLAQWKPQKPLLIYRPLIERTEWDGCRTRNPDYHAYWSLIESIRDQFFVVSIADLEEKKEWIVGNPIQADVELHKGELTFEQLAALFSLSALVFGSPGMSICLAQAVSTPVVNVVGGYETSQSFSAGAKWTPYLGIDPIKPCGCFLHHHKCNKAIDLVDARAKLQRFIEHAVTRDIPVCA